MAYSVSSRRRIRGWGGCIPREFIAVSLWVLLYVARAVSSWIGYGSALEPDTWLYVDSEHWWYPSPLGRLVGIGGYQALAFLNVVGAGALAAGIYRLSRQFGGSPNLALGIFFVCPASLYTQQAGVSSAAAALVIWSVVLRLDVLGWTSLFLHPATGGNWSIWRMWHGGYASYLTLAFFGFAAFVGLLLSDYGGIIAQVTATSVWYAALTALIGLSVIIVARMIGAVYIVPGRKGLGVTLFVIGALEAGAQGHVQVRYLLPGTAALCAALRFRA